MEWWDGIMQVLTGWRDSPAFSGTAVLSHGDSFAENSWGDVANNSLISERWQSG